MRALVIAGLGISLTACATSPLGAPTTTPIATTKTVAVKAGQIAQCGHWGAPMAGTIQSDEWKARLARVIDGGSGDELMGGPPVAAVMDPEGRPVVYPSPAYPPTYTQQSIEGICNVLMDVDLNGNIKDPLVACSRSGFQDSVEASLANVRFPPKMSEDGRRVERWNVELPITFCMD